jgi:C_GCAxxG_C_C family probable redox protein
VGQEKIGAVNEDVVRAMGAFGGGVAGSGGICGALLGGVALISSLFSRGNPEEKEDPRMWRLSDKLSRSFQEITREFGGMNCRDIAGVNWKDRTAARAFYADPDSRRKYCFQVVGDAAYALGELLEEEIPRHTP